MAIKILSCRAGRTWVLWAWSVRICSRVYKPYTSRAEILTTLAFWLRSSVVSVLNSLTTIMGAPPSLLVILFLPPLFPGLCLQPRNVMTLPLHYWLVLSRDPLLLCFFSSAIYTPGSVSYAIWQLPQVADEIIGGCRQYFSRFFRVHIVVQLRMFLFFFAYNAMVFV